MRHNVPITSFLVIFLTFQCANSHPDLNKVPLQNIIEFARNRVFKVVSAHGKWLGSAFCINTKGDYLTCAHVISASGKPLDSVSINGVIQRVDSANKIIDTISVTFPAEVSQVIPSLDLAVLHVADSNLGLGPIRFPYFQMERSSALREGDDVILSAFIDDPYKIPKPFFSKGIISTIREGVFDGDLKARVDLIQMDLSASRGNSGGAVISLASGKVIAMMDAAVFQVGNVQSVYPIALTMSQIGRALDSLRIPHDIR